MKAKKKPPNRRLLTCPQKNGVHCNTAEAEWSVFRPWWVRFRGVAKRHIYLYLAQCEYWRNRRHWTPLERLEEMIGFLFAFLQKVATARLSRITGGGDAIGSTGADG